MKNDIKTQQFGIGNLLYEGWQVFRANLKNILLVILCVYLPINIFISFIPLEDLLAQSNNAMYRLQILNAYNNAIKMIDFFIGTIAVVAIALIVEKSLQGETLSWFASLRYGLSKWLPALGTGLLAWFFIICLALLLIIPGIIWGIYYTFWVFVVALRNLNGKAALDYSESLVKGQWWRVFGTLFFLKIIQLIVSLAVSRLLNLVSGNPFYGIIPNTMVSIINVFFIVVMVIFFLNNDYRRKPARAEQIPLIEQP